MVKQELLVMQGGFSTDVSILALPGGTLASVKNFEVAANGYERSMGYERFDGQPSPTGIAATEEDDLNREAARALIQPVPGSGGILGVCQYKGTVYAFRNSVDGLSAKMFKSSPAGWVEFDTGIVLEPDGDYRFIEYNFYGNADSSMLYGCDGVNKAFQFDGTTFTQITTGMAVDKPKQIIGHSYHLFLAFKGGSLQHSSTGLPLDWDGANSAGEIGIGEEITGLNSLVGGVLQISTDVGTNMLSGSSSLDWTLSNLRTQDSGAGVIDKSAKEVSGVVYYLSNNGIKNTAATQAFGDFVTGSFSQSIQKYINNIKSAFVCSYLVAEKSQYRLVFVEGDETEILTMTFSGDQVAGYGIKRLPCVVTCAFRTDRGLDKEVIYLGSADGYVYKDEIGTSYDGQEILATFRTSYSYQTSPTQRKRYRKLEFVLDASREVLARIKPLFSYGRQDTTPHIVEDINGVAGGGIWGLDNWGEFSWSSPSTGVVKADIGETATSISISFTVQSKFTKEFTVSNVLIDYTPRRLGR